MMLAANALGPAVDTDAPLTVDQVSLSVHRRVILQDISLRLPARAVTALVGPSGSGKSSLLRVLNRLWDPVPGARVTGRVAFGAYDVYDRRTDPVWLRRHVGMVFQRPTPFPRSILDNLLLPLKVHGVPARERHDRAEHALRRVALWDEVKDRLHHSALTLSGGQQQRLCIARALTVDPTVLLMDEPASALDPRAREAIDELMTRLAESMAILLVTHHLEEARRISAMTGVMLDGRLVHLGPTETVFTAPPAGPVAGYLVGGAETD